MGDGYMSITVCQFLPTLLAGFFPFNVQRIVLNGVIFNSVGPPPLVRSAIYMTSASPGFHSPPPPCAIYPRLSLLHPQPIISRISVILLGTVPLSQTSTNLLYLQTSNNSSVATHKNRLNTAAVSHQRHWLWPSQGQHLQQLLPALLSPLLQTQHDS